VLWASFKIAMSALRANKMRSALTMLGIIIGVGAVVIMVAVGSGASEQIKAQIESVGSNLLIVVPGATSSGGARMGMGSEPTLTGADAQAIARELPSVRRVAPIWGSVTQVVSGNQNWSTQVTGTTQEFFELREWQAVSGRIFNQQEMKAASKVALIGQTVADNLFGGENPVDRTIRVKRVPFTVIGLLDRKGPSPRGDDQDDAIYVPVTTAQKRLFGSQRPDTVRVILVQATSAGTLKQAEEDIGRLLAQRHHIQPKQERDFSVRNISELLAAQEKAAQVMSMLLGAIAAVSLLVGGIGIMNIMLVSVTERTREIGIRMAIGARAKDVLVQFLIEALVLSLLGGLVGLTIGVGGSRLIEVLSGWPLLISAKAVALAFSSAAAVGVFFGFYPARKAALMRPIDALRYE
jgi:putative ABC transport system permease protein